MHPVVPRKQEWIIVIKKENTATYLNITNSY